MTRLTAYVAKKVKASTKPKKKIGKVKKSKPAKVTPKDIEAEKIKCEYSGKITPYIKSQLIKKAKARKEKS